MPMNPAVKGRGEDTRHNIAPECFQREGWRNIGGLPCAEPRRAPSSTQRDRGFAPPWRSAHGEGHGGLIWFRLNERALALPRVGQGSCPRCVLKCLKPVRPERLWVQ